jgi:two-component system, LytTR family, response regulator
MIRALIVDDELHAREELAVLLRETGSFDLIGSCGNAVEAIKVINREKPAVLFLDIDMPVLSGFDLLGMIDAELMPHVVFVTAYDEFALKAFDEKTLDYLLKPVEPERLARTVEKLKSLLSTGTPPAFERPSLVRIPCCGASKVKLIDPAEVEYVRSDLSGVHVVTPKGEFFTDLTLKLLESRTCLLHCHKQFLINVERVDEIVLLPNELAEIRTRSGRMVPVSRRYLKNLKSYFNF